MPTSGSRSHGLLFGHSRRETAYGPVLPAHKYPPLYGPPSRYEIKLKNLDEGILKRLLSLLPGNYTGGCEPPSPTTHASWFRKQQIDIDHLDPHLLQSETDNERASQLFDDLPLCHVHRRLKPSLVATLAVPLIEECVYRSDAYRSLLNDSEHDGSDDDPQLREIRSWITALDAFALNFIQMTPGEAADLKAKRPHDHDTRDFVWNRCPACICAMVGGSPILLPGILSCVLARHELQKLRGWGGSGGGSLVNSLREMMLRRKASLLASDEADKMKRLLEAEATNICKGRNGPRTADEISAAEESPPPPLKSVLERWMEVWRAEASADPADDRCAWGKAAGTLAFALVVKTLEAQVKEGDRNHEDDVEIMGDDGLGDDVYDDEHPIGTPALSFDEFERAPDVARREERSRNQRRGLMNWRMTPMATPETTMTETASADDRDSLGMQAEGSPTSLMQLVPGRLCVRNVTEPMRKDKETSPARSKRVTWEDQRPPENGCANPEDHTPSCLVPSRSAPDMYDLPGLVEKYGDLGASPGLPRSPGAGVKRAGLAEDDITFEDVLRDSVKSADVLSPASFTGASAESFVKQSYDSFSSLRGYGSTQEEKKQRLMQPIDTLRPHHSPTSATMRTKRTKKTVRWFSDEPGASYRYWEAIGKQSSPPPPPPPWPSTTMSEGLEPPRPQHVAAGEWALVPVAVVGWGGALSEGDQKLEVCWTGEGVRDKKTLTLNDVLRAAWDYEERKSIQV